ncbi:hypothetical protein HK099_005179 [Clydaea vesicula]|uniref:Aspartate-semialdehyde dehydrogenase n=1 Tax=Clydaea vesicula TaxID=447962 RepID=A0AAD5XZR3_9FUNG|nr:hypothetical protein HK099_005179 [Clydaea vesicula]KAJ3385259.1 hypothetical protein HDU92_003146 [Lobulomyces angularis]
MSNSSTRKIPVGILGATGTVGQRFIQLLENHPNFEIKSLAASPRSEGKAYSNAVNWKLSTAIPKNIQHLVLKSCKADQFKECRLIFSGLDSDVAEKIEEEFFKAELFVFSNAKNHRMSPTVPLCVPLVNTNHLDIIPIQQKLYNLKKGFLVTNANCATTGLVVPLKALEESFGEIERVSVTTLQSISGAGYPGVPSLDIFDNVIPFIDGEEEKLEIETSKILGNVKNEKFENSRIKVSATCNRVAVLDGHMECVSVSFKDKSKLPDISALKSALQNYECEAQKLKVYSTMKNDINFNPIVVFEENNRPQPRLDRDVNFGMSVSVGRIRKCDLFDFKFTVLLHNTILGAAGSSIMNAEVALKKGYVY